VDIASILGFTIDANGDTHTHPTIQEAADAVLGLESSNIDDGVPKEGVAGTSKTTQDGRGIKRTAPNHDQKPVSNIFNIFLLLS